MKSTRIVCLLLAALMTLLCAACAMGAPLGETAPEEAGAQQEPPITEEQDAAPEEAAAGEEAAPEEEAPAPTEEPAPREGTYKSEDGAVLKVEKNGECSYKTTITAIVSGKEMTDTVTFYGTVDGAGSFSFTKVTYHGMDITSMAAKAGYDDASQWEAEAAALYGE